MLKLISFMVIVLLSVASLAAYLYLNEIIITGDKQVVAGQILLDQGRLELDAGKVKLEAGKQELKEGKQEYEQAEDNFFLVWADKLLKGGKGFESAREQIAGGESQISAGEDKIIAGEKRIDAGAVKLQRGTEQLQLAKKARLACAISAAIFALLSIVLGLYWRRTLLRTLHIKHT